MNVLSVVSNHMAWLQNRHLVISGNIANVDTPGYKAMEVESFGKIFDNLAKPLAVTQPGHIAAGAEAGQGFEVKPQRNLDVNHSGNDVMIEKEMRRLGENVRGMSYDTSIARAFHRMLLQSVKSS